jgi:hypothetical protein
VTDSEGVPLPDAKTEASVELALHRVTGEGNKAALEHLLRKGRNPATMPGCDCCYRMTQRRRDHATGLDVIEPLPLYKVAGKARLCYQCATGHCPKPSGEGDGKGTCRVCPKCHAWLVNLYALVDHIHREHPALFEKAANTAGIRTHPAAREFARRARES